MNRKGKKKSTSPKEMRRRQIERLFRDLIPEDAIAAAKQQLPANTYGELLAWLNAHPAIRRLVFPAFATDDPYRLQRFQPPAPCALIKEIVWASIVIAPYATLIKEAIALKQGFVRSALRGDPQSAAKALTDSAAKCGESLWLLSARLAHLQIFEGLEAQKGYERAFREKAPELNVAAFLVHHVSVRNEPTVTYGRYVGERRANFAGVGEDARSLQLVIRFYTVGDVPEEEGDMATLLATGSTGSVVDYYEMLLRVASNLVGRDRSMRTAAAAALASLDIIGDSRLRSIAVSLEADATNKSSGFSKRLHSICNVDSSLADDLLDQCLAAEESVGTTAAEAFKDQPDHPSWIPLLARIGTSIASETSGCLCDEVARQIGSLSGRLGDVPSSQDWLCKIAVNLGGTPWGPTLQAFVESTHTSEPDGPRTKAITTRAVGVPLAHASLHYLMDEGVLRASEVAVMAALEDNATRKAIAALGNPSAPPVPTTRMTAAEAALAEAHFALRTGAAHVAVSLAAPIRNANAPYTVARAVNLYSWALLAQRDFSQCIEAAIDAYERNPGLLDECPLRQVADLIPQRTRETLGKHVSLAAFYDLVTKRFGTRYDVARKDAFEDFLAANGVKRPSQLPAAIGEPLRRYVYFLRYLCVPAVLETSLGGYRSDVDLAEERLEICGRLVGLDPQNAAVYQDEIKELVRELTIGKRVREVDQNRVYVDVDGVKRQAIARLGEAYKRYIAFVRHGLTNADIDDEVWEHAIERLAEGDATAIDILALPANEPASLLAMMVQEIADLYFLNPAHGVGSG